MDVALPHPFFLFYFTLIRWTIPLRKPAFPPISVYLEARFDIVSIYFEGGNPVIEHYEDAFLPSFWKK